MRRPRSQEDYIEISREYQSVIAADVPLLDEQHDDEARRFIALVDELYDRNVNLVVPRPRRRRSSIAATAARRVSRAPPSRLTEMQSAEYLAREHRA